MLNRWLSYIREDTRINEIGIPGTHDSASVYTNSTLSMPLTYTQRLDVKSQLDKGARVLDMRVAYERQENYKPGYFSSFVYSSSELSENIKMCHGPIVFDITLDDQLGIVNQFLADQPTEFVALIFQQQGRTPAPENKERATKLIVEKIKSALGTRIFLDNQAGSKWPTVGELAGKVMVFSRLNDDAIGFFDVRKWGHNSVSEEFDVPGTGLRIALQDRFTEVTGTTDTQDLHSKFGTSVENVNKGKFRLFKKMRDLSADANTLKINHLSHSLKSITHSQPYMLGEMLNAKLKKSVGKGKRYRGFLMLDDLKADLCQEIVDTNNQEFRKPQSDQLRGQKPHVVINIE